MNQISLSTCLGFPEPVSPETAGPQHYPDLSMAPEYRGHPTLPGVSELFAPVYSNMGLPGKLQPSPDPVGDAFSEVYGRLGITSSARHDDRRREGFLRELVFRAITRRPGPDLSGLFPGTFNAKVAHKPRIHAYVIPAEPSAEPYQYYFDFRGKMLMEGATAGDTILVLRERLTPLASLLLGPYEKVGTLTYTEP